MILSFPLAHSHSFPVRFQTDRGKTVCFRNRFQSVSLSFPVSRSRGGNGKPEQGTGRKNVAQDVAALTLASSLIAQQPQNGKDARLFRVAIPDALAGRIDGKAGRF